MKRTYPIELVLTSKMWKYFSQLPFEKDGELALPTQRDASEERYLNNFVELGLLYEVVVSFDKQETTFYLTHVGKLLLKKYK